METKHKQITCVGFAPDPEHALVVPFVDERKDNNSYWTFEDEVLAWMFVQKQLLRPEPKLMQNGLYDVQYFWRAHGLTVNNFSEDTMLLHYSIQPMMEKSLGFLGSVYTSEPAWKLMRGRGYHTDKREE